MRVPTYSHLKGWKTIIDRLIDDINSVRGDHAGKYYEIKERYGSLRVGIDWSGEVPADVIGRIDALIDQAEALSEVTCIDCGASAIVHDWDDFWFAPCCPAHARIRAKNSISLYRGDGWHLNDDFKIYNPKHELLSTAAKSLIDASVKDAAAYTWHAAQWLSKG